MALRPGCKVTAYLVYVEYCYWLAKLDPDNPQSNEPMLTQGQLFAAGAMDGKLKVRCLVLALIGRECGARFLKIITKRINWAAALWLNRPLRKIP